MAKSLFNLKLFLDLYSICNFIVSISLHYVLCAYLHVLYFIFVSVLSRGEDVHFKNNVHLLLCCSIFRNKFSMYRMMMCY